MLFVLGSHGWKHFLSIFPFFQLWNSWYIHIWNTLLKCISRCLLLKAAFPLGLLYLRGGALIVASQRHGGPCAVHPSPWVCIKRGIREASACVAAIVYQETRGWLNNPPVNTALQWETRKWQDPRDLHTHMPFPWSWRIAFIIWKIQGGKGAGGELVSQSSWFLNEYEKEERYMKTCMG